MLQMVVNEIQGLLPISLAPFFETLSTLVLCALCVLSQPSLCVSVSLCLCVSNGSRPRIPLELIERHQTTRAATLTGYQLVITTQHSR